MSKKLSTVFIIVLVAEAFKEIAGEKNPKKGQEFEVEQTFGDYAVANGLAEYATVEAEFVGEYKKGVKKDKMPKHLALNLFEKGMIKYTDSKGKEHKPKVLWKKKTVSASASSETQALHAQLAELKAQVEALSAAKAK